MRLASQLTGWDIDILTEAEESERRQKEFAERTQTFMEALDVDETVAQLLASEGFRTVEEIAFVEPRELASIEGFDADTAAEIQARAQGHLARIEAELDDQRKALGVSDDLKEIDGLTTPMLVKLGENGVKTLEDLADCASDDLVGWTERGESGETAKPGFLSGFDVSREQADAMIMDARVRAGWIEAPAPQPDAEAAKKAKAPENSGGIARFANRRFERRSGVGADLHCHGDQRRPRGDAALRARPRWIGCPRYPPQAARPRGVDAAELRTVSRAASKQAFSRAFRAKAEAPAALAEAVDALLERDALQSLSIANKAGLVVAGAFKVDAAIESGRSRRSFRRATARRTERPSEPRSLPPPSAQPPKPSPASNCSRRGQLDLALGRTNVIHAALKQGAASSAFLARADRLRRYRESEADATTRTERGGAPADQAGTLGRPIKLAERPGG